MSQRYEPGDTSYADPKSFRIDPDLKSWIVPLRADEYHALYDSIREDGCRDSIVIDTHGRVIDGHNRLSACLQLNTEVPYVVKDFDSDEDAKNWMINNQLARRNVTAEQRNYLIGKLYNEEKKEQGAPTGNKNAIKQSAQNEPFVKTSEKIAEDHNIAPATVKRAGQFAEAVDTIARDYGEEEKQKILNREVKTSQKEVKEVASQLNSGMFSSETPEWYTPQEIIDAVVSTFYGTIDLDPCSNSKENPHIPAKYHFTQEDNGLLKDYWNGRVYMNPPYGRGISDWINKLIYEYRYGGCDEAIALVPARTDTVWFKNLSQYPWCGIKGRLKFSQSENSAPFPSAVFYLGENIGMFYNAFSSIGTIFREIVKEEAEVW